MSRRGDCYDNAVIEAFFSSLKSELADRSPSRGRPKTELFDCIEVFYNQRRNIRRSAESARPNSNNSQRHFFSASEEDRTNGDQLMAHVR
jgi:transposase InsO family protein